MGIPHVVLKVIVAVHFILTIWGGMNGFLPYAYLFMNLFILSFGVWSIALPESRDPVLMFLVLHLFSIIQDIVFLGIYEPRGHDAFETPTMNSSRKNEYRFCLGIFQDRGGSYDDLNIPGIPGFPQFGQSGQSPGRYENIDQPVPTNNTESAEKHGEP